jgi:predicted Rossmann-fold nucleotide-binding protein
MEAASRGAAMAGGQVIGVTAPALFVSRDGANPHVTREITASTLTERIGTLMDLATGVIALPGSIGTAAELLIAWNANHIARRNGGSRIPAVAVGEAWHQLWTLMSGRLGAFGGDVHTVAHADEGLDWLLSQPEIG